MDGPSEDYFTSNKKTKTAVSNAKNPDQTTRASIYAKRAKAKAAANVENLTDTLSAAPVNTGL